MNKTIHKNTNQMDFFFSPSADGRIEIMNSNSPTKLLVDQNDFEELLALRKTPKKIDKLIRFKKETLSKDLKDKWLSMGWGESLTYFCSSLISEFHDSVDTDGSKRREKILEYESLGQCPTNEIFDKTILEKISCPRPDDIDFHNNTYSDVLLSRHSVRKYLKQPMALKTISNSLYYGLKKVRDTRKHVKNLLEAQDPLGHLFSYGSGVSFIVALYSVEGMFSGYYLYEVDEHCFYLIKKVNEKNLRMEMNNIIWHNFGVPSATGTILAFTKLDCYMWKYRHEKALRNHWIEIGRIFQDIILHASNFGVAGFVTPAIRESKIKKVLNIDNDYVFPFYTFTFGKDINR